MNPIDMVQKANDRVVKEQMSPPFHASKTLSDNDPKHDQN